MAVYIIEHHENKLQLIVGYIMLYSFLIVPMVDPLILWLK